MALVALGILLHNAFILGELAGGPWLRLTAILLGYALLSWLVLALLFGRARRVDLGLVFLVADLLVWTLAIHASGGERSWLFFILIMRVADQTNTSLRRALAFAHLAVAAYGLMLLWIAVVEGRPLALASQLTKVILLYGAGLYIALAARPAEQRRARVTEAVRVARQAIVALEDRSRQLEDARRHAEEASRSKSRFLAAVSHEFRTPLNAIIGFAQILAGKRGGALDPRELEYVRTILRSARRLLALVSNILELSRTDLAETALTLSRFGVEEAVRAVVAEHQLAARDKSVALAVEIEPDLPSLRADEMKFRQMVDNLLGNAVKFTPPGGRVTVRASAAPGAGEGDGRRGRIEISVADTGIGIPPADQERIFRAFEQVGADGGRQQGIGLGLALTQRLAELHEGQVRVESDGIAGHGSRFTLALPMER